MLRVKDLLPLSILQSFSLVSGEKGLENHVTSTGVLDHEFMDDHHFDIAPDFAQRSFVVTSFVFAKDKEDKIAAVISKLADMGVSALAYKPVIFDTLPKEAIDVADKLHFPIFKIQDKEVYYEDLIFTITTQCRQEGRKQIFDQRMEEIIEETISPEKAVSQLREHKPYFKERVTCYCITSSNLDLPLKFYQHYQPSKIVNEQVLASVYKDSLMVLISSDKEDFPILLNSFLTAMSVQESECIMGISREAPLSQIVQLIWESRRANYLATKLKRPASTLASLGTFDLALTLAGTTPSSRFQERFLSPLLENSGEETYSTLLSFVLNHGDLEATAKELHCHKNTIRYRLKKYAELLSMDYDSMAFYENISMAIKLHLMEEGKSY